MNPTPSAEPLRPRVQDSKEWLNGCVDGGTYEITAEEAEKYGKGLDQLQQTLHNHGRRRGLKAITKTIGPKSSPGRKLRFRYVPRNQP
ncbi:hypothetical protein DFP74_2330 [Nocardiopsis sp. Huas11]|nr:hypothetical protein DFP74_2330 [Nocardiopsis sp. Huas11]